MMNEEEIHPQKTDRIPRLGPNFFFPDEFINSLMSKTFQNNLFFPPSLDNNIYHISVEQVECVVAVSIPNFRNE